MNRWAGEPTRHHLVSVPVTGGEVCPHLGTSDASGCFTSAGLASQGTFVVLWRLKWSNSCVVCTYCSLKEEKTEEEKALKMWCKFLLEKSCCCAKGCQSWREFWVPELCVLSGAVPAQPCLVPSAPCPWGSLTYAILCGIFSILPKHCPQESSISTVSVPSSRDPKVMLSN